MQAHGTGGRTGAARTVVALARACHLEPALAVTAVAVLLAVAAGVGPGRTVLVGAAVLAGQAAIGWCNDWLDADRDRAVGRQDKPVVQGLITPALLRAGTLVAAVLAVALSLSLGVVPGTLEAELYDPELRRDVA